MHFDFALLCRPTYRTICQSRPIKSTYINRLFIRLGFSQRWLAFRQFNRHHQCTYTRISTLASSHNRLQCLCNVTAVIAAARPRIRRARQVPRGANGIIFTNTPSGHNRALASKYGTKPLLFVSSLTDRSIILVLVKHHDPVFPPIHSHARAPTLPEEPAPILNSRAIPVTRITVSFSTAQQLCIHRDDG